MKRFAISAFIVGYLGLLTFGNVCHTLQYKTGMHPLMYLIVWDMFCGWSAYASQTHIIAEGESEKFYELAPGPWGEFKPWGRGYARHNYDPYYNHVGRVALNTLKHTRHEPITRIFVVEENWPKKYDLPDNVWKLRYGDQPKDVQRYTHVKMELNAEGKTTRINTGWLSAQYLRMLSANPRLQVEIQRSRPLLLVNQEQPGREFSMPASAGNDQTRSPFEHAIGHGN